MFNLVDFGVFLFCLYLLSALFVLGNEAEWGRWPVRRRDVKVAFGWPLTMTPWREWLAELGLGSVSTGKHRQGRVRVVLR